MSRCNYCTFQYLGRAATAAGGTVETRPNPKAFAPDGVDVFIQYKQGEPVWAAWLMKLPYRCVC